MYLPRQNGPYQSQRTSSQRIRSDSRQVNFAVSNPRMQMKSDRLRTFDLWPNHIKAAKETLADSGLYYLGIKDRTKCFVCDGGLENWEIDDDPYYEHAKMFPRCEFIRSLKGDQYVDAVAAQNPNLPPPKVYINSTQDQGQAYGGSTSAYVFSGLDYFNDAESSFTAFPMEIESHFSHTQPSGVELLTHHHVEDLSDVKTRSSNVQARRDNSRDSQQQSTESQNEVKKRISEMKNQDRCKICLDRDTECVFSPCGHLCACKECSSRLSSCPICRTRIGQILRVFKN